MLIKQFGIIISYFTGLFNDLLVFYVTYEVVKALFAEHFPNIPTVITLAPVCRPTWLVEMECMAVKEKQHENFRNF